MNTVNIVKYINEFNSVNAYKVSVKFYSNVTFVFMSNGIESRCVELCNENIFNEDPIKYISSEINNMKYQFLNN